jgi:hypothetical protein
LKIAKNVNKSAKKEIKEIFPISLDVALTRIFAHLWWRTRFWELEM